jgi:GMP synthase-like glutamine amidotransferase
MHLAILVTNTDESAFAQRNPKDGVKFDAFIRQVRPGWSTSVHLVKDGQFPDSASGLDGAMITGSPASVNQGDDWIDRLLDLIRDWHARDIRLFGACFGHQAIARALGGAVRQNPGGWVHGVSVDRILSRPPWAAGLPDPLRLYASHKDQVTIAPEGAETLTASPAAPITGFRIGHTIYTTQHHPEMTGAFIAALTDEMQDILPEPVLADARTAIAGGADGPAFAEAVARFFEAGPTR